MAFLFSLLNLILNGRSSGMRAWFSDDSDMSFGDGGIGANAAPAGLTFADKVVLDKQTQLEALHRLDPDFNEIAFLTIAANAYSKALQAEGAMSPDDAAAVVTKAYHDRLATQTGEWQADGLMRVISDLKIDDARLFKITIDGSSQSATVRIAGSSVRCTKDATSGVVTDGSNTKATFNEYATFVRPAGSVTPKTTDLGGASHCPSCGAPAPATATVCPFCGTPLTPGAAAWLLDKVSQSAYS